MDEALSRTGMPERPMPQDPGAADADGGPPDPLRDPRALTILTTEHWSLLSARGLVYNEAFARGGMFLTFLSASLVALGLIATATAFSPEFRIVALIVLALDLFIGIATLGRVADATGEDIRCLQGMNRIRHAYHETVPGLEPYFITSPHDDAEGVFAMYGAPGAVSVRSSFVHGLTTMPGMISVIDTSIGAVLAGLIVLTASASSALAIAAGIVAFALGFVLSLGYMIRTVAASVRTMDPRFPTPNRQG